MTLINRKEVVENLFNSLLKYIIEIIILDNVALILHKLFTPVNIHKNQANNRMNTRKWIFVIETKNLILTNMTEIINIYTENEV